MSSIDPSATVQNSPVDLSELNNRVDLSYHTYLPLIAEMDAAAAAGLNTEYQGSWHKRGGPGAYMTIARKWDRIEALAERNGYNLVKMVKEDTRPEGLMDDIRDLRRYLLLVEAWFTGLGICPPDTARNKRAAAEGCRILGIEATVQEVRERVMDHVMTGISMEDAAQGLRTAARIIQPSVLEERRETSPSAPDGTISRLMAYVPPELRTSGPICQDTVEGNHGHPALVCQRKPGHSSPHRDGKWTWERNAEGHITTVSEFYRSKNYVGSDDPIGGDRT